MISSLWKLTALIFFSLFQAAPARGSHGNFGLQTEAKVKNTLQIVVDDGRFPNYTITLDGSTSTGAERYRWVVVEKPRNAKRARFTARRAAVTNVTISTELGLYQFQLRTYRRLMRRRRIHSDAYSRVYVEKPSSAGMYLFASNVVKQLHTMHFQYLALSQNHQRATKYQPRVAKYFRKLSRERRRMSDLVMEHVAEKQATEDMINSCPTDYVGAMLSKGFAPQIHFSNNVTNFMTSAFKLAFESEVKLASELSNVIHHAKRNHDYELYDFVAMDVLPQVTKTMVVLKRHLETALQPFDLAPSEHRERAYFLFDKYLEI